MVDPARHFIPIKDLEKFVDLMAYYKFNRLHLHLTDNQGWRLPVPGYPKLKSIASRREESFEDGIPHEGIYTKQELKELVAYCAARGIEVIPEIDVPGHNQALAAAYPEFFCFPNPDTKVKTDEGVTSSARTNRKSGNFMPLFSKNSKIFFRPASSIWAGMKHPWKKPGPNAPSASSTGSKKA